MRAAIWRVALVVLIAGCSSSSQGAPIPVDSDRDTIGGAEAPDSATTDPGPVPADSTSQPQDANLCDSEREGIAVAADVDGDGIDDPILVAGEPGEEAMLVICDRESNELLVSGGNKPIEVYVVDIEGDGLEELIIGGPFGGGLFAGGVVRFADSEWVFDSVDIRIVSAEFGQQGQSFGCVDLTGNSSTELVTLRYEFDGDLLEDSSVVRWQRFRAGEEDAAPQAEGTFSVDTDREAIATLMNGTCGEQTLILGQA